MQQASRNSILLLLILFVACGPLFSQPSAPVPDTLSYQLGYDRFMRLVINTHPVARQAALVSENGRRALLRARGNFDPVLSSSFFHKEFKRTEYYEILDADLKIPTWLGIDILAGYGFSEGSFLNPESVTGPNGLTKLGLALPLGQGLFTDKRRAAVRKAQAFVQLSEAEQLNIVNDLLLDASVAYFDWLGQFQANALAKEAVGLTSTRLNQLKQQFRAGDAAPIDTVETSIILLDRRIKLNDTEIKLQKSRLELSNYLWDVEGTPIVLGDQVAPPSIKEMDTEKVSQDSLNYTLQNLQSFHPKLLMLDYKMEQLEIDRRLKAEFLKPKLDLKGQLIKDPTRFSFNRSLLGYDIGNYTFGATFKLPLFLREERGALQQAKIKIRDMQYEQERIRRDLQNKIQGLYFEHINLDGQIDLIDRNVDQYQQLLDAENRKFNLGESSQFLVNTRETKYLEARLKLIESFQRFFVIRSTLAWSSAALVTTQEVDTEVSYR